VGALLAAHGAVLGQPAWPWWWSGVLALAWAPLLWQGRAQMLSGEAAAEAASVLRGWWTGLALVAVLLLAALVGHALPFGLQDAPHDTAGLVVLGGMAMLYTCLALLQARPQALARWRRWSYAGFYVDEYATRATLWLWPARWTPPAND
jgi:NAD(P)H-quinone oxidoreductase subunit 5